MLVFLRRAEHAFDVAVQGSHDAYPREHSWPVVLYDQRESLHRSLPFFAPQESYFGDDRPRPLDRNASLSSLSKRRPGQAFDGGRPVVESTGG